MLMCGTRRLPWDLFESVHFLQLLEVYYCEFSESKIRQMNTDIVDRSLWIQLESTPAWSILRTLQDQRYRTIDLRTLLYEFVNSECSDPRDKVYI